MMRAALALSLLIGLAAPAAAAQPPVATVELSNFKFAPSTVDLHAGVPTVLRLHNSGGGGHSFAAPAFFAAARLEPQAAALVRDGKVEVPGHATIDLPLVPVAGQYPLKCTHAFHAGFGMKGTIRVQ